MDDSQPRWPLYGEPATKGDVIGAMVLVRSCIVDIYVALSAMKRQDKERFADMLKDLNVDDDALMAAIDKLGGAVKKDD